MYYQKHQTRFVWPIVAVIVVIIVFHVIIYMMTSGGGWFWLLLSSLPPILILSFFAYSYRFYFVSADHDELRFGYALWSVRLNVTDIAQIEETNIRWIEWRGHGWRLKSLKHIGYITGNGSGIHLALSTGREYTFNYDDPMACITAFDERTTLDHKPQAVAIDEPETPEIAVADEQPDSSKL